MERKSFIRRIYRFYLRRQRPIFKTLSVIIILSILCVYFLFNLPGRVFLYLYRDNFLQGNYRQQILDTLDEFDKTWRGKHGLEYVLNSGTVLGAYRHGGFIPYDDDFDLAVHIKYRNNMSSFLKGTRLNFIILEHMAMSLKMSKNQSGVSWPYIDVFFYEVVGDIVNVINDKSHPKDTFLPFTYLPFEGRIMAVPRCPVQYLRQSFGSSVLEKCCIHGMNHRTVTKRLPLCTACSNLHSVAQFTTWREVNKTHHQQELYIPGKPFVMKGVLLVKENCS